MFRIIAIDQLLKELDAFQHTELHVHHTYLPNHSHFDGKNHQKLQQGMKNYHVTTNGWDDIAQHVTLTPDGLFVVGRAFNKQPISIKGYNGSGNKIPFMVEMVGNFDIGHDKLQGKQLTSILRLAHYFDSKGRYIRFHHENAAKSCPGTSLYKMVNGKVDKSWFMGLVRGLDEDMKPFLTVAEANEHIMLLKEEYAEETNPEKKKQIGQIADILRRASGQPTQNS